MTTLGQFDESLPQTVDRLRETFSAGRTKPLAWRRTQLRRLRDLVTEHQEDIADALMADLRRPREESYRADVDMIVSDIDHLLDHLEHWTAAQPVEIPENLLPPEARASIRPEPLGTVLIIGPWNYPFQLVLMPLAGALAAGNTVVVKPSELAPAASALVSTLIDRYLDNDAVAVVEGGVAEATALLALRFDHIFYTGNPTVGRIVLRAAAEHLTPVTLELGGKSPAYVDDDVDLAEVARRLTATKFANAGQICVAPDYVLAPHRTVPALESALRQAIGNAYGADPAQSPAFGRLVNERHFERVAALLDSGRVVTGGQTDRSDLYIAPTVLSEVQPDAPVMLEEIFGPVLPIVGVTGLDEAISFITARPKPLALYAFTADEHTRRRLIEETSSGALGLGLPIAHLRVPDLPFGGVGTSGHGSYHGTHSFETFSHRKAILRVPNLRG
jgi:aldehyde dehydrogenase (NAD+)